MIIGYSGKHRIEIEDTLGWKSSFSLTKEESKIEPPLPEVSDEKLVWEKLEGKKQEFVNVVNPVTAKEETFILVYATDGSFIGVRKSYQPEYNWI